MKITPRIWRGLNHLQAIANLEDGPAVDDREGRKDHEAAIEACQWIILNRPKPCPVCTKPMTGRKVVNRDNKLVHPRCSP